MVNHLPLISNAELVALQSARTGNFRLTDDWPSLLQQLAGIGRLRLTTFNPLASIQSTGQIHSVSTYGSCLEISGDHLNLCIDRNICLHAYAVNQGSTQTPLFQIVIYDHYGHQIYSLTVCEAQQQCHFNELLHQWRSDEQPQSLYVDCTRPAVNDDGVNCFHSDALDSKAQRQTDISAALALIREVQQQGCKLDVWLPTCDGHKHYRGGLQTVTSSANIWLLRGWSFSVSVNHAELQSVNLTRASSTRPHRKRLELASKTDSTPSLLFEFELPRDRQMSFPTSKRQSHIYGLGLTMVEPG